MKTRITTDIDFIVAKTRAKHSLLYEGDRLSALVRHRALPDLAHELYPTETFASHVALERRLVEAYAESLVHLWRYMRSPRERLFVALGLRLQVENIKVLLRSYASGQRLPPEALPIIRLPDPFRWEAAESERPGGVQDVLESIPEPVLRQAAGEAFAMYADHPVPLYLEAGLDQGYLRLLCDAWRALGPQDRAATKALVDLESDIHNVMFTLRARVHFKVDPEAVVRLAAGNTERRVPPSWVAAAAKGETVREVLAGVPLDLRRALIDVPAEPGDIERKLWQMFYRLADRVYFRSFFNVGCPYAFAAVKRMELANLITVVEAVRYGLPVEDTLKRLLRPTA